MDSPNSPDPFEDSHKSSSDIFDNYSNADFRFLGRSLGYAVPREYESLGNGTVSPLVTSSPSISEQEGQRNMADILVDREFYDPVSAGELNVEPFNYEKGGTIQYFVNFQICHGPSESWTGLLEFQEQETDVSIRGSDEAKILEDEELIFHVMPNSIGYLEFRDTEKAISNHHKESEISHSDPDLF